MIVVAVEGKDGISAAVAAILWKQQKRQLMETQKQTSAQHLAEFVCNGEIVVLLFLSSLFLSSIRPFRHLVHVRRLHDGQHWPLYYAHFRRHTS
jgi:hypothetical protein